MRRLTLLTFLLLPLLITALAGLAFQHEPLEGDRSRAQQELKQGVLAYRAGQFQTAIEHFKRAIELDPTLLNARIFLATAYATQFRPDSRSEENRQLGEAAIRQFEKVLELDPNYPTAIQYLASLYFGMAVSEKSPEASRRLFEKSKEFRRRLVELEPQNSEHYYSIAVTDWALAYKSRMQMKVTLRLGSDEPLPTRQREDLAKKNSAIVDEGIGMLQKALELNPKYLDAINYLNLMYREKADLVADAQEREEWLRKANDLVERHKRLREELGPTTPPQ